MVTLVNNFCDLLIRIYFEKLRHPQLGKLLIRNFLVGNAGIIHSFIYNKFPGNILRK